MLTAIILTRDEQLHLRRAIESLKGLAGEVVVVDSFSTDATLSIAKECGARVYQRQFTNQAEQFQWALDTIPINTEWVMRLDADEVLEEELRAELAAFLPTAAAEVGGVNLHRKHIFMGRWIRYGGRFPITLLRVWRRGWAHVEQAWMDEHVVLDRGRSHTCGHCFADWNLHDLSFFVAKHNRYATREAVQRILQARIGGPEEKLSSARARTIRWLKERVYYKVPFELASLLYFVWRYVVRLGFLDGRPGFAYHFLQGYWYRYLVGARLQELQQSTRGLSGQELLDRLHELTGLRCA